MELFWLILWLFLQSDQVHSTDDVENGLNVFNGPRTMTYKNDGTGPSSNNEAQTKGAQSEFSDLKEVDNLQSAVGTQKVLLNESVYQNSYKTQLPFIQQHIAMMGIANENIHRRRKWFNHSVENDDTSDVSNTLYVLNKLDNEDKFTTNISNNNYTAIKQEQRMKKDQVNYIKARYLKKLIFTYNNLQHTNSSSGDTFLIKGLRNYIPSDNSVEYIDISSGEEADIENETNTMHSYNKVHLSYATISSGEEADIDDESNVGKTNVTDENMNTDVETDKEDGISSFDEVVKQKETVTNTDQLPVGKNKKKVKQNVSHFALLYPTYSRGETGQGNEYKRKTKRCSETLRDYICRCRNRYRTSSHRRPYRPYPKEDYELDYDHDSEASEETDYEYPDVRLRAFLNHLHNFFHKSQFSEEDTTESTVEDDQSLRNTSRHNNNYNISRSKFRNQSLLRDIFKLQRENKQITHPKKKLQTKYSGMTDIYNKMNEEKKESAVSSHKIETNYKNNTSQNRHLEKLRKRLGYQIRKPNKTPIRQLYYPRNCPLLQYLNTDHADYVNDDEASINYYADQPSEAKEHLKHGDVEYLQPEPAYIQDHDTVFQPTSESLRSRGQELHHPKGYLSSQEEQHRMKYGAYSSTCHPEVIKETQRPLLPKMADDYSDWKQTGPETDHGDDSVVGQPPVLTIFERIPHHMKQDLPKSIDLEEPGDQHLGLTEDNLYLEKQFTKNQHIFDYQNTHPSASYPKETTTDVELSKHLFLTDKFILDGYPERDIITPYKTYDATYQSSTFILGTSVDNIHSKFNQNAQYTPVTERTDDTSHYIDYGVKGTPTRPQGQETIMLNKPTKDNIYYETEPTVREESHIYLKDRGATFLSKNDKGYTHKGTTIQSETLQLPKEGRSDITTPLIWKLESESEQYDLDQLMNSVTPSTPPQSLREAEGKDNFVDKQWLYDDHSDFMIDSKDDLTHTVSTTPVGSSARSAQSKRVSYGSEQYERSKYIDHADTRKYSKISMYENEVQTKLPVTSKSMFTSGQYASTAGQISQDHYSQKNKEYSYTTDQMSNIIDDLWAIKSYKHTDVKHHPNSAILQTENRGPGTKKRTQTLAYYAAPTSKYSFVNDQNDFTTIPGDQEHSSVTYEGYKSDNKPTSSFLDDQWVTDSDKYTSMNDSAEEANLEIANKDPDTKKYSSQKLERTPTESITTIPGKAPSVDYEGPTKTSKHFFVNGQNDFTTILGSQEHPSDKKQTSMKDPEGKSVLQIVNKVPDTQKYSSQQFERTRMETAKSINEKASTAYFDIPQNTLKYIFINGQYILSTPIIQDHSPVKHEEYVSDTTQKIHSENQKQVTKDTNDTHPTDVIILHTVKGDSVTQKPNSQLEKMLIHSTINDQTDTTYSAVLSTRLKYTYINDQFTPETSLVPQDKVKKYEQHLPDNNDINVVKGKGRNEFYTIDFDHTTGENKKGLIETKMSDESKIASNNIESVSAVTAEYGTGFKTTFENVPPSNTKKQIESMNKEKEEPTPVINYGKVVSTQDTIIYTSQAVAKTQIFLGQQHVEMRSTISHENDNGNYQYMSNNKENYNSVTDQQIPEMYNPAPSKINKERTTMHTDNSEPVSNADFTHESPKVQVKTLSEEKATQTKHMNTDIHVDQYDVDTTQHTSQHSDAHDTKAKIKSEGTKVNYYSPDILQESTHDSLVGASPGMYESADIHKDQYTSKININQHSKITTKEDERYPTMVEVDTYPTMVLLETYPTNSSKKTPLLNHPGKSHVKYKTNGTYLNKYTLTTTHKSRYDSTVADTYMTYTSLKSSADQHVSENPTDNALKAAHRNYTKHEKADSHATHIPIKFIHEDRHADNVEGTHLVFESSPSTNLDQHVSNAHVSQHSTDNRLKGAHSSYTKHETVGTHVTQTPIHLIQEDRHADNVEDTHLGFESSPSTNLDQHVSDAHVSQHSTDNSMKAVQSHCTTHETVGTHVTQTPINLIHKYKYADNVEDTHLAFESSFSTHLDQQHETLDTHITQTPVKFIHEDRHADNFEDTYLAFEPSPSTNLDQHVSDAHVSQHSTDNRLKAAHSRYTKHESVGIHVTQTPIHLTHEHRHADNVKDIHLEFESSPSTNLDQHVSDAHVSQHSTDSRLKAAHSRYTKHEIVGTHVTQTPIHLTHEHRHADNVEDTHLGFESSPSTNLDQHVSDAHVSQHSTDSRLKAAHSRYTKHETVGTHVTQTPINVIHKYKYADNVEDTHLAFESSLSTHLDQQHETLDTHVTETPIKFIHEDRHADNIEDTYLAFEPSPSTNLDQHVSDAHVSQHSTDNRLKAAHSRYTKHESVGIHVTQTPIHRAHEHRHADNVKDIHLGFESSPSTNLDQHVSDAHVSQHSTDSRLKAAHSRYTKHETVGTHVTQTPIHLTHEHRHADNVEDTHLGFESSPSIHLYQHVSDAHISQHSTDNRLKVVQSHFTTHETVTTQTPTTLDNVDDYHVTYKFQPSTHLEQHVSDVYVSQHSIDNTPKVPHNRNAEIISTTYETAYTDIARTPITFYDMSFESPKNRADQYFADAHSSQHITDDRENIVGNSYSGITPTTYYTTDTHAHKNPTATVDQARYVGNTDITQMQYETDSTHEYQNPSDLTHSSYVGASYTNFVPFSMHINEHSADIGSDIFVGVPHSKSPTDVMDVGRTTGKHGSTSTHAYQYPTNIVHETVHSTDVGVTHAKYTPTGVYTDQLPADREHGKHFGVYHAKQKSVDNNVDEALQEFVSANYVVKHEPVDTDYYTDNTHTYQYPSDIRHEVTGSDMKYYPDLVTLDSIHGSEIRDVTVKYETFANDDEYPINFTQEIGHKNTGYTNSIYKTVDNEAERHPTAYQTSTQRNTEKSDREHYYGYVDDWPSEYYESHTTGYQLNDHPLFVSLNKATSNIGHLEGSTDNAVSGGEEFNSKYRNAPFVGDNSRVSDYSDNVKHYDDYKYKGNAKIFPIEEERKEGQDTLVTKEIHEELAQDKVIPLKGKSGVTSYMLDLTKSQVQDHSTILDPLSSSGYHTHSEIANAYIDHDSTSDTTTVRPQTAPYGGNKHIHSNFIAEHQYGELKPTREYIHKPKSSVGQFAGSSLSTPHEKLIEFYKTMHNIQDVEDNINDEQLASKTDVQHITSETSPIENSDDIPKQYSSETPCMYKDQSISQVSSQHSTKHAPLIYDKAEPKSESITDTSQEEMRDNREQNRYTSTGLKLDADYSKYLHKTYPNLPYGIKHSFSQVNQDMFSLTPKGRFTLSSELIFRPYTQPEYKIQGKVDNENKEHEYGSEITTREQLVSHSGDVKNKLEEEISVPNENKWNAMRSQYGFYKAKTTEQPSIHWNIKPPTATYSVEGNSGYSIQEESQATTTENVPLSDRAIQNYNERTYLDDLNTKSTQTSQTFDLIHLPTKSVAGSNIQIGRAKDYEYDYKHDAHNPLLEDSSAVEDFDNYEIKYSRKHLQDGYTLKITLPSRAISDSHVKENIILNAVNLLPEDKRQSTFEHEIQMTDSREKIENSLDKGSDSETQTVTSTILTLSSNIRSKQEEYSHVSNKDSHFDESSAIENSENLRISYPRANLNTISGPQLIVRGPTSIYPQVEEKITLEIFRPFVTDNKRYGFENEPHTTETATSVIPYTNLNQNNVIHSNTGGTQNRFHGFYGPGTLMPSTSSGRTYQYMQPYYNALYDNYIKALIDMKLNEYKDTLECKHMQTSQMCNQCRAEQPMLHSATEDSILIDRLKNVINQQKGAQTDSSSLFQDGVNTCNSTMPHPCDSYANAKLDIIKNIIERLRYWVGSRPT